MSQASAVPKAERIELVRRLLVEGTPDWEIRRRLVQGVTLEDGRVVRVSQSTAERDLDDVGLAYKALLDNPLLAERVVGAVTERLTRIADKAEGAGQYHAAIRANLALVDIVGRVNPRWSRKGAEEDGGSEDKPVRPYEDMSDDELREVLERKRARVAHLELVHDSSRSG